IVAAPGTQLLLPMTAALAKKGQAVILSPTYAEHRRAAAIAGHVPVETSEIADLDTADLAIVVNPNNPDGRVIGRTELLDLATRLEARDGMLVVDEAFMDVCARDESLVGHTDERRLVVLRSFGKFYGLAGIRLGFAVAPQHLAATLRDRLGPWAVSGPALDIGFAALSDAPWRHSMRRQLAEEATQLDALLADFGLPTTGGTSLFRLVRTSDAQAVFRTLGKAGIFVRAFERDRQLLRFGIPGREEDFARLHVALDGWRRDRTGKT
ncbi:MAG: aminotransferase class I/II-fold pyridoxal phosphate-dependent enzyme, partial [Pseudomonadota bacterium]